MTSRRRTPPPKDRDLGDLAGHRVGLWRQGNLPDQQLDRLTTDVVANHLCALYLLADEVLASASFYFESESTRAVTRRLRRLFESGDVMFFVDNAKESFLDHATEKQAKSPVEMVCYQDLQEISRRATDMAALGYLMRRPASSISERIASLWCADLASTIPGSLGDVLTQVFTNLDERMQWVARLLELPHTRAGDFVWEFVEPALRGFTAPARLLRAARRRLASFYSTATAQALGLTVVESAAATEDRKLDSGLFLDCMDVLGVSDHFARLSVGDLIALKHSPEWLGFKAFYWALVDGGAKDIGTLRESLPLYAIAEEQLARKERDARTVEAVFRELRGLVAPRLQLDGKPLRVMLVLYSLLGGGVISAFRSRLSRTQDVSAESSLPGDGIIMIRRRTVVEVDLVGYSSILRVLEQGLDQISAMALNEQIQGFVKSSLPDATADEPKVLAWTGDGAIVAFEHALEAQAFVEALHSACRAHNAARTEKTAKRVFRSGAATGDIAMVTGDDGQLRVAGDTIVRAVRLEAAAKPGELVADDETVRSLPESESAKYSGPLRMMGKRDEAFVAYRRIFDAGAAPSVQPLVVTDPGGETKPATALTSKDVRRGIVELSKRVPREHVDLLMIILMMPIEQRSPSSNSIIDRMANLIEWAEAKGRLDELHEELKAYAVP